MFLILLLTSCQSRDSIPPQPAVYHWQQDFDLTEEEQTWLSGTGIQALYLRFFDLDLNDEKTNVIPFSVLNARWPEGWEGEVIPCVFITNRSLQQLSDEDADLLADRMVDKIDQIIAGFPSGVSIREWQLDCDWSTSTQTTFFRILQRVRNVLLERQIQLSATIRLHQVKYADRTGIPPVDRGMLMFYNMDNVRDPQTENSILDLEVAGAYLDQLPDYPLPLDIALPIFNWAVWLRADRTLGLFYPFDLIQLADTSRILAIGEQRFQLQKSTYLDGRYLYAGDQLRVETVHVDTLALAVSTLKKKLPQTNRRVAFFALDPHTVKAFSYEDLARIMESW